MGAAEATVIDDDELGGYQEVRPLGRGGMGLLYVGRDPILDRAVAIKLIAHHAPGAAARERFLIEARAIARLNHPNVVGIYRAGETKDGRPYLVQELVRGRSLDRLSLPLPAPEVRRIGVEMARGLAAAHRRGVLHRDLKPANVMLADDGTVKLLDFGLAKLRPLATEAPPPPPPASTERTPTTRDGHPRAAAPEAVEATAEPATSAVASVVVDETAADPMATTADLSPPDVDAPAAELALTQPGAVMGTPRYMAPEQWRGEPATERSDLYALGAVLFELAAGRPVYPTRELDALRVAVLAEEAPRLDAVVPGIDRALAAVIDRALARDPRERPASADAFAQALATAHGGAPTPRGANPYRGLAAFADDDRALFFGRGDEVGALVDRLRTEQAVVVVGDSGVGKSSLCRAGVLPAIAAGGLGGARAWRTASLRPGADPMAALAAALDDADPARALAAAAGDGLGLALFVDQAEELITQAPATAAAAFATCVLDALAASPGLRVITAVRGDFVTRLAEVPGLTALVRRGLHLVAPLDDNGRREAVIGPAELVDVRFEPAAVDALVTDSAGRGGLPLLQFALTRLWQTRDPSRATITATDVAAIGGVAGALTRHADGVIAGLTPDARAAARRLLTALVTTEGTGATRDAAELSLDGASTRAALDALIAGRLVVARDGASGASYTLAHDALIAHWPTLADWLADDRGQRALRQRVATAAREWERLGRGKDGLLAGRPLAEALTVDELGGPAAALVLASRRAIARRRLVLVGLAAAALAAVIAVALGTRWANRRARDREVRRLVANAERLAQAGAADVARMEALRAAAFVDFDQVMATNDPEAQRRAEATWAEALAAHGDAVANYRAASVALEPALLLDSRAPLRRRMAELLATQAELAAVVHDDGTAAALIARIAPYDAALIPSADATAHLAVDVSPPAHVTVACVGAGEPRVLAPPRYTGDGAHHDVIVPTVSCTITATAPDHVEVRDVVMLTRDERRAVRLALPPAATAPPGFVYVPAGRFLYGSAEPEAARKANEFAPLHPVAQPAFWIARHETTFGEWLAFLDHGPATARREHLPAGSGPSTARAQLVPDGERGWAFELTDGAHVARYRRGEIVVYTARTAERAQAWERWPVVGVSIDDARAFAAWLDASGRVPGARLCTNAEWERAARGADARLYPHGDRLRPRDANWLESYGQEAGSLGPDEVGRHPTSDSPFGVADLAGNVWEFVESPAGIALARGGGWYSNAEAVQASNVFGNELLFRNLATGVRLCADAR